MNFDDEDAVREATYSLRWHERRKMFESYQDGEGDRAEQEEQDRIERQYDEGDDDKADGDRGDGDGGYGDEDDRGDYRPAREVEDNRTTG